jgi:hypothetical protein
MSLMFQAQNHRELSFKKGDIIYIKKQVCFHPILKTSSKINHMFIVSPGRLDMYLQEQMADVGATGQTSLLHFSSCGKRRRRL